MSTPVLLLDVRWFVLPNDKTSRNVFAAHNFIIAYYWDAPWEN